ncbi:MAG: hypothetical protein R2880_08645 [Deinococcales bacterium]
MIQVPISQALNELEELLKQVAHGQELVIIDSEGLAFKIMVLPRMPQPIFGSAQGLVYINSNFDEPIEDFEAYMP